MRIEVAPNDTAYQQTGSKNVQTQNEPEMKAETSAVNNQRNVQLETAQNTEEKKAQNEHEIIQAIEKANKHFKMYDRRLEFSIHDATKQIIVKVIDTENDTVIREIPSEKILDMVAHLWQISGFLVDEKR